jgi:hypothetical protein
VSHVKKWSDINKPKMCGFADLKKGLWIDILKFVRGEQRF